jgi:hypothetical protein
VIEGHQRCWCSFFERQRASSAATAAPENIYQQTHGAFHMVFHRAFADVQALGCFPRRQFFDPAEDQGFARSLRQLRQRRHHVLNLVLKFEALFRRPVGIGDVELFQIAAKRDGTTSDRRMWSMMTDLAVWIAYCRG